MVPLHVRVVAVTERSVALQAEIERRLRERDPIVVHLESLKARVRELHAQCVLTLRREKWGSPAWCFANDLKALIEITFPEVVRHGD